VGPDGDEEAAEVCTNYRLARRRQSPPQGRREDKTQEAEATEAKKKAKKPAPAKGSKRGQKGAPKEEEEKPAEQTEAEKRALEQEEKRKLEEEARELQRPKTYTSEEMEEYQHFAAELEQFLGDLTVR